MSEQPTATLSKGLFVIAIAASAGGLAALSTVVADLPAAFAAAILIVQHLSADYESHLVEILERRTALRVKWAENDDRMVPGVIYVGPPRQHLLVDADRRLLLSDAALVNYVRPAADVLFGAVADVFAADVIAVVLTGRGVDGADGIRQIKERGGIVIAQDEESSEYFSMPQAAIATGSVDLVLPIELIGPALNRLVNGQAAHSFEKS